MESQAFEAKENFYIISDFFYQIENKIKLPDDFAQRIIELENDINRAVYSNSNISERHLQDLASLYKVKVLFIFETGVEYYSGGLSPSRHSYFYNKLQKFLTDKKILKLFEEGNNFSMLSMNDSVLSSSFVSKKKRNCKRIFSNKFSLFLNNLKSQTKSIEYIKHFDVNFNNGLNVVRSELQRQESSFQSNKKRRFRTTLTFAKKESSCNLGTANKNVPKSRILCNGMDRSPNTTQSKNYIVNTNDKFDLIIQLFLKNFTFIYFHRILEKPLGFAIEIYKEVYYKKVEKYLHYEDQIKHFHLLNLEEENETYKISLDLIIESLQIEKESVLFQVKNSRQSLIDELKLKAKEIQVSREGNLGELLEDCFNKIVNVVK